VFGPITPEKALVWLGSVIMENLANRGTAEASRQICRIKESLPGEQLAFISKYAEELVRRNTWQPLSPRQFLDLPRTPDVIPEEPANEQQRVARIRSEWLDGQLSRKGWGSDLDIAAHMGPSYNTIQRYRSGKKSSQDRSVRGKLAKALGTDISNVPEWIFRFPKLKPLHELEQYLKIPEISSKNIKSTNRQFWVKVRLLRRYAPARNRRRHLRFHSNAHSRSVDEGRKKGQNH
jgi:hypothetical protein